MMLNHSSNAGMCRISRLLPWLTVGLIAIAQPCIWTISARGAITAKSAGSHAAAHHLHKVTPRVIDSHLPPASPNALAVTHHTITLNGKRVAFTARAGYMPIKAENGKVLAKIFFIAYTKDEPKGKADHRPLTFCFNGGPGAASNWLNIGCAGPYRLLLTPGGNITPPPFKLVKNHQTWLGSTDLVFIDPVGTGYSRKEPGVPGGAFYGVQQDISSVADFIRLYMTMYRRWGSPIFLAGESYGTTRAAGLSDYLSQHDGIDINGMILISCALNFQLIIPSFGNETPYPLFMPTYATTAWYYHKLSPKLEKHFHRTIAEAEHFAVHDYLPALEMGSHLSKARKAKTAEEMSHLTGLSTRYILAANLRVGPAMFEQQLLRSEHRVIGRMDTRLSAYTPNTLAERSNFDPAMSRFIPAFTTGFNELVESKLHYRNYLPYRTLSDHVYPWHFGTDGMGYLYVTDNLQRGMIRDPAMQVLVCSGYFDLATPFFGTIYSMDHLHLSKKLQSHIHMAFFRGGHMVYHPHNMLVKLRHEVAHLIESAR
jgi:carboxypeptidase C (cathepsin A)